MMSVATYKPSMGEKEEEKALVMVFIGPHVSYGSLLIYIAIWTAISIASCMKDENIRTATIYLRRSFQVIYARSFTDCGNYSRE